MKRNADGTLLSAETILEMLESRFDKEDYPYLSDILGSDWPYRLPFIGSLQYWDYAMEQARNIYPDPTGCLGLHHYE